MAARNGAIRLHTPSGTSAVRSARMTHTTNQGVSGTAILHTPITLTHADGATYQLSAEDEIDAYESPPLVAFQRKRSTGGSSCEVQLLDEASWRLSRSGRSFDTFLDTTSAAIAAELATDAGVTIVGMPSWYVGEEDVKQSKLADAFRRLLAAGALEYRVNQSGHIVVADVMWSAGSITFAPDEASEVIQADKRVTGLRVEKSSRIKAQVCFVIDPEQSEETSYHTVAFGSEDEPNGMVNVLYRDEPSGCAVTFVGIWNGSPDAGGTLVRSWGETEVGAVLDPSLPATHATFVLEPSAEAIENGIPATCKICFFGTPVGVPSGIDLSFELDLGTTDRPAPQPWNEPLIPTAAFAQAREAGYLRQRNKDYHRIEASGAWRGDTELGQTMTLALEGTWPDSRIESYTHDFSLSGWRTSISGIIYPDG